MLNKLLAACCEHFHTMEAGNRCQCSALRQRRRLERANRGDLACTALAAAAARPIMLGDHLLKVTVSR
jgi:hypothetical protein